jgi:hypothetical protein
LQEKLRQDASEELKPVSKSRFPTAIESHGGDKQLVGGYFPPAIAAACKKPTGTAGLS